MCNIHMHRNVRVYIYIKCEVNNCNRLDVHSQSPSGCCSDSSGIYRNHWLRLASLRATSGLDKTLTI